MKKIHTFLKFHTLLTLLCLCITLPAQATYSEITFDPYALSVTPTKPFYGLAAYYNTVHYLLIQKKQITSLPSDHTLQLNKNEQLGVAGRFNIVLFDAPNTTVKFTEDSISIKFQETGNAHSRVDKGAKRRVHQSNGGHTTLCPPYKDDECISTTLKSLSDLGLQYHHLWGWLAALSKAVEWSLVKIHQHLVANWGWSIAIFAVLLKLLLLPISLITTRLQRQVSQYQSILAPQLAEITAHYDGEEAHKRIMAAYKALGITPFYALKPMIGALIQIPILVAIFNALGEMPQLAGASFLWIKDLAYPDAIATLPFVIPFLGNTVNLLPIIMTLVTILSTIAFRNPHAPAIQAKRQKRNLYLMAAAFFLLFYPFPAAMVLYWTLANILHAIQQQVVDALSRSTKIGGHAMLCPPYPTKSEL